MSGFVVKGRAYKKPIACCGFCGTPVFILHEGAYPNERIAQSILKSKPIHPQPAPEPKQEPRCATCGKLWCSLNFTLKEGAKIGPNTADRPGGA